MAQTSLSPAIELQGLTKDYHVGFWRKRPRRALSDISFAVEEGEIFGFLGPNGAGKTTTLKLLTGLIFPTSGKASILGRPIEDAGMHRDIGYLPEQPYFYDYLTARELLDYLVLTMEASRKDWLKDLSFVVNAGPPQLWALNG